MIVDINKDQVEKWNTDDMIPVEKWDGECWKAFFGAMKEITKDEDSAWNALANFVKEMFIED